MFSITNKVSYLDVEIFAMKIFVMTETVEIFTLIIPAIVLIADIWEIIVTLVRILTLQNNKFYIIY